jgi:hypothetical protein
MLMGPRANIYAKAQIGTSVERNRAPDDRNVSASGLLYQSYTQYNECTGTFLTFIEILGRQKVY